MDLPKGARVGQRFGRWVIIGPSLDGDPRDIFVYTMTPEAVSMVKDRADEY